MGHRRLFDAREALLCEGLGVPDHRWRTVSLVTAVRGLVTWIPGNVLVWPAEPDKADPESLLKAFLAATGELTRRGLDADSLVRYGMRNEIAWSLMGWLVVNALGVDTSEVVRRRGIDLEAWRTALPGKWEPISGEDVSLDLIVQRVAEAASASIQLVEGWIMRAPLDALLTLAAPYGGALGVGRVTSAELDLCERYAWLVDRFSTTSPRDWLTSSLRCEFRWRDEREPPPCATELMDDREVDPAILNAEIARRSVYRQDSDGPDPETVLASEMSGHARMLCHRGRPHEAAALFEFAALRRPNDANARNNFGFCLIPEDPTAALAHLEAAADLGYDRVVVNVYNRVCCYVSMGRPRAAITTADAYWGSKDDRPGGATLWAWQDDGTWAIVEVANPHLALAELMVKVAQGEGLRQDEERWRSRQSKVASGS